MRAVFEDLLAGLFDEGGGGFVDVVWVHHAGVQCMSSRPTARMRPRGRRGISR